LDRTRPNIVFLQETLSDEQRARDFLLQLRPSWATTVINSIGNSGGLLVSWDPNSFNLNPFLTVGGILLTGVCISSKKESTLLNVCGPCKDRKLFWSSLADNGILSIPNLVIVDKLNFILSSDENWGGSFVSGSIEDFYRELFISKKLIDVKPPKLVPTWRNGRSGQDAIARRLDRCFVIEGLLSTAGLYKSWVEYPYVSDHAPFLIQLENSPLYKSFPYKFNADWLRDSDFVKLVHIIWNGPCFLVEGNK